MDSTEAELTVGDKSVHSIKFNSIYYPAMEISFVYMQVGIHHYTIQCIHD